MKTKFKNVKKLSNLQIVKGIRFCLDNSNDLFDAALALQKNKSYGVATSILILSVEELVKALALFNMLIFEDENRYLLKDIFESKDLHKSRHDFALFTNEYLKHVKAKGLLKSTMVFTSPQELSSYLLKKINFERIMKNFEREKKALTNWFAHANAVKNKGLYVSFNNKWVSPKQIDAKDFLKSLKVTKSIRNDINLVLPFLLDMPEKDVDPFVDFLQRTLVHFVAEAGIEPTAQ